MRTLVFDPTQEERDRGAIYYDVIAHLAATHSLWGRDERALPGLATKERTIVDRKGHWALKAWRCSDGIIDRVTGIDLSEVGTASHVFLWNLNQHVTFHWRKFPADFDRFLYGISLLHTLAAVSK